MNDEFESIYRAHVDAVFRYALRISGNRDLAGDFTSEAFLELYRNWDSIDRARFPGWLLTVAKLCDFTYQGRPARRFGQGATYELRRDGIAWRTVRRFDDFIT